MNLNRPGIYIAYGGALKKGYRKIGRTKKIGKLKKRYNTVYGDSCTIEYCFSTNSIDDETEIHEQLDDYREENELFNVNLATAKQICKAVTGAKTMRKL